MEPLPTIRQLRHLIALAETTHFGRAAEACAITQSSLSASIRELETVLGRRIVERSRRSVVLTPLGAEVVARAREVVSRTQGIVELVQGAGAPLSGTVRLGTLPTIAPFLLPRALPPLRASYPDLRLYLKEQKSADLVDAVRGGALDVALMAFPYPTGDLSVRVFAEDAFWVAFPRDHDLAELERISAASLEGESLLLLEEGHCMREHALSVCGAAARGAGPDMQGSSLHTLVQMADNGLGMTVLPKMAIDAGITRGTHLAVRPLEGAVVARRIGLAWRRHSAQERDFQLLAGFLEGELATPLPPSRQDEAPA